MVISEFRTRGPNGKNDEFIELYNLSSAPVNIGAWKINSSNGSGSANTIVTINSNTIVPAHGHFLVTNRLGNAYSGGVAGDQTYNSNTPENGGVALLNSAGAILDQVGTGSSAAYGEGTRLGKLSSNTNRSYERKLGGTNGSGQDTDDNRADFRVIAPSDPQNLSSAAVPPMPTSTSTSTPTATNTRTHTPSATLTNTNTSTVTPTQNPSTSNTPTSTPTITPTGLSTSTSTPTPTSTNTSSNTPTTTTTPTSTSTQTNTLTDTPTATATSTSAPTLTGTAVPTCGAGADYLLQQTSGSTVVAGTTLVPGSQDDDAVLGVALPFTYYFYGQAYAAVNVSTNGNLQFGSANAEYNNACLPYAGFNQAILAHWDDLSSFDAGEGIFTSIEGSAPARIFNIEWRSELVSDGSSVIFEVRLYEAQPGKFEIIYGTVHGSGAGATVGVQRDLGGTYTTFSCDTAAINAGLMLAFTEQTCATATPTATLTHGSTNTTTPTHTWTPEPANTATPTATRTPTSTTTNTPADTNTPTSTTTNTPTQTHTPTNSPTHTPTPTNSPTDTSTATPTDAPTNTPSDTPANTSTNTPTDTPTDTPTNTPTNSPTDTPTNAATNSPTGTATNTPIPIVCEPVTWTTLVNVTASGNSLVKRGAAGSGWNAGASSRRALLSGDGYVEATVSAVDTYRMFGLSSDDAGVDFSDIDFAAYLAGPSLRISEGGANRGSFGPLAVGDVVRVAVQGNQVKYFRNGVLVYTSDLTPTYPLRVDTAIHSWNGTLQNVILCGQNLNAIPTATPTYTPTPIPTVCERSALTEAVNLTVVDNTIQKTGGAAATWDAGAVSAQSIISGTGSVAATVDSVATYRMFGLSHGNTDVSFGDIDFAAYLAGTGLMVYEGGSYKATVGALAVGDTVKVGVDDYGVVRYYLNGTAVYTSSRTPVFPLLLDTSINSMYGRLTNLTICLPSWTASTPTFTPSPTFTATGTPTPVPAPTYPCQPVTWTALVNVTASGNTITKTGGLSGQWDAGAVSLQQIASGDGYAQASVVETNTWAMFGLDQANADVASTDVDFALFTAGGVLKVYESGVLKGDVGSYAIGDVLKVAVSGGAVRYYRNSTLLYTSGASPNYPLYMNTAINSRGGHISNAYMCAPGFGMAPRVSMGK